MTTEPMVELLRELVEIESPTGHSSGVRAVGARLAAELERCGGEAQRLGDHLRVDLEGEPPPLLLLGHAAQVRPVGPQGDARRRDRRRQLAAVAVRR